MVGGGIRTGVTDQAADRALRLNRHILDGAVCKRDLGIDRAVVLVVIAGCPANQTADARAAGADNFAVLQMAVIQFDSSHGIHAVDKCADSLIIRCVVDIRTSNGQILDHNAGFARKAARKQGGAQAGDGLAVAVQGDDALTMVSIHTHRRPVLTGHIDVVQQLDHGVAGFVCGRKGVGEGGILGIADFGNIRHFNLACGRVKICTRRKVVIVDSSGGRTGCDVELVLGGFGIHFGCNIKVTADTGAVGLDGDFLLVRRAFNVLLKQALNAAGGGHIRQRDVGRLGSNDSRLFGQTAEGGLFDLHRGRDCQRALVVGLDTADTGEGAVLHFGVAAVVPKIIVGTVSKLAVVEHRLAVLVVAHAVGEGAVRVGHGVFRRAGVAEPAGEVIGAVTVVTTISWIRFAQLQVCKTDIDVVLLISQDCKTAGDADFRISGFTNKLDLGRPGQASLCDLHPAGSSHINLTTDLIGDDAASVRFRRIDGIAKRTIARLPYLDRSSACRLLRQGCRR